MISITPNSNFQSHSLFSQLSFAFQCPHSPCASSLAFCYRQRPSYGVKLLCSLRAAWPQKANGGYDPELRSVLELATDNELAEIGSILYGRSYFSPLLKSIAYGDNVDDVIHAEAGEGREAIVELLESRFFFLAADARATLRGWRPSYRDVLLDLRKKLKVPCSARLTTGDMEAEIFLHVLQEFSRSQTGTDHPSCEEMPRFSFPWEDSRFSNCYAYTDGAVGASQFKLDAFDALNVGAKELRLIFLKGGGMLTLTKIYQLLRRSLSGRLLLESANYQIKQEAVKKGGQLAAASLESRVALLAAKKGLASAASRYFGLRSMMMLIGPLCMEQIDWHSVHSLRSKRHPKEDLELRLGHSLFSKVGTMTTNCAVRFPETITIDDDDDVQIFTPGSFIEGRGMFSHGRSWAPVVTEEDLELRLGFRGRGSGYGCV